VLRIAFADIRLLRGGVGGGLLDGVFRMAAAAR
jgi:hypothetical protein